MMLYDFYIQMTIRIQRFKKIPNCFTITTKWQDMLIRGFQHSQSLKSRNNPLLLCFSTLLSVYSKWEWLWEIILYMVISTTHLWLQAQKHHLHAAQQAANQKSLFKGRVPLKREELKQLVSTRGWTEGGLTKAQYSMILKYIHTKLL